jgi:hypothetical protein
MTDQMDAVHNLIRNAFPPLYAKLAAKKALAAIKERDHWKDEPLAG